jgi:hypothetical protein
MPTSVGPNTFGEENLVFGYDTGDVNNSYRGEPTENLATLDLGNTSVWYNEDAATTTKELQSETLFGYPVYKFASRPGSIWITPFAFNGYNKANGPITVSAYIRNMGAVATVSTYLSGDYSTDSLGNANYKTIPTDGVWRRYSWTRTAADMNTANQLEFRTSGDNMQISCPQVEHKLHPTPIVEGTRSATQGLIDLTGNSTIDLTNVSFDSNAQMTFDGTDDYIDLGDNSLFDFDNGIMTVEAIVTFPSSWTAGSQYPNIISKGASAGWDTDGWALFGFRDWGGDKSWGFGIRNGSTNRVVSRQNVAEDVYWHIVATLDRTTMRLYENGIEVSTNTQTINPASNNTSVRIARDPSSNYFPGKVPYTRVYNRALTASEIKSNYNAIKGRFNI